MRNFVALLSAAVIGACFMFSSVGCGDKKTTTTDKKVETIKKTEEKKDDVTKKIEEKKTEEKKTDEVKKPDAPKKDKE